MGETYTFTVLDGLFVAVILLMTGLGIRARLIGGAISLILFYFGTIVAALTYEPVATFLSAFGEDTPRFRYLLAFWFTLSLFWFVMRLIARRLFPDTSLPKLGSLDYAGGALLGLVNALLLVSLLFTTLAFATRGFWGRALSDTRITFSESVKTSYARDFYKSTTHGLLVLHFAVYQDTLPLIMRYPFVDEDEFMRLNDEQSSLESPRVSQDSFPLSRLL